MSSGRLSPFVDLCRQLGVLRNRGGLQPRKSGTRLNKINSFFIPNERCKLNKKVESLRSSNHSFNSEALSFGVFVNNCFKMNYRDNVRYSKVPMTNGANLTLNYPIINLIGKFTTGTPLGE